MKDIFSFDGKDLVVGESEVPRAKNLFETQLGSLSYLPEWGIDLDFFISSAYKISNEAFGNYLQQQLGFWKFNAAELKTVVSDFMETMIFIFTNKQNETFIK